MWTLAALSVGWARRIRPDMAKYVGQFGGEQRKSAQQRRNCATQAPIRRFLNSSPNLFINMPIAIPAVYPPQRNFSRSRQKSPMG